MDSSNAISTPEEIGLPLLFKGIFTILQTGSIEDYLLFIMLIINKKVKITSIVNYHEKSENILNRYFNDRYTIIEGVCSEVMCQLKQSFDLITININNSYELICNDIESSKILCHEDTFIIINNIDTFDVKMALRRYSEEFIPVPFINHKQNYSIYKWKKQQNIIMPTIVTMLFNIGNFRSNDWYLERGRNGTLSLEFPLIIFTSVDLAEKIIEIRKEKGLEHITTVITTALESSYYYDDLDRIRKLSHAYKITNINPVKDTPLYVILGHSKEYFMTLAINNNYYSSSHFIWMDFGLSHVASNFDSYKVNLTNVPDKIRCMLILPYRGANMKEYYKFIYHNVAAGLFSGKAENLLQYCKIYRETYNRMLKEEWYQLDEAVMSIILHEHPNLFSIYVGDYSSLITNYSNFNDCFNVSFTALQVYLDIRNYTLAKEILNYLHSGLCYHSKYKYTYLINRLICDWYISQTKEISEDVDEIISNLLRYDKEECIKFLEHSKDILKFYVGGDKYQI